MVTITHGDLNELTLAGAFGQTAGGFGQAQAPYIAQRQLQTQASIANTNARAGIIGAGVGAVGSVFSDENLKRDAIMISVLPSGIPVYDFEYDNERRIGVFASDVEQVAPGLVSERFGYKMVQYEDL